MRGIDVLNNPNLNKGTAFSPKEREDLGLVGLLPDGIETLDRQVERVLGHLAQKPTDLERYIYLIGLVMCLLNNSDIFIFAKGRFPSSLDLGQNLLSFSPPHVTLGIEVMLGEVLHDSVHQLAHAAEAAGQDRLLAQVSEEAFDQIHPG